MINLKERLLTIASMVQGYQKPADIGTDHAYIPIYLIQSGICSGVIATDIRQGPLRKAARNVERYQLTDKIQLRLGDGIQPIQPGECDCFIIAGMGGVVISQILEASMETVRKAALVLQPVYTQEVLREYLFRNGFRIETERLVCDEGRIYVVIKASYDGIIREEENVYCHIGRALFEQNDPLLQEYLVRKIRIQTKIVHGLSKSEQSDKISLYQKENALLNDMKDAYNRFFHNDV